MKNLIFALLLFAACTSTIANEDLPINYEVQHTSSDIENPQKLITDAFKAGIVNGDTKPLMQVYTQLENLNTKNAQNILSYWLSYADYYSSITAMQKEDADAAEMFIDRAIDRMSSMKNKNSEDYSLLAMCQGFGIQFKGMRAMFISGAIKKNIKKAIDLDPENLRAHYVAGSNDYYTPEQYGGGKKVEDYLTKALQLEEQNMENPFLPSWGKAESYNILLSYYIDKEAWDKAKTLFETANKAFPNDYSINSHAPMLINK